MKNVEVINKRKDLADQVTVYMNSHKNCKELSPIDIFNQFIHDKDIMITDDFAADWLLNFIHDIKKMDDDFLTEAQSI